jgi:hypothetical protein
MGGSKGLAVLVSSACIAILAAAPAHAVVTPAAFGDCKRAAAKRAVRATNLLQLMDRDLNSSPALAVGRGRSSATAAPAAPSGWSSG